MIRYLRLEKYNERGGQKDWVSIQQHPLKLVDLSSRAGLTQRPRILLLFLERIVHGRENLKLPSLPLTP